MSLHSLPTNHRPAGVRIGDAERDAVCAALGEHYGAGRLTAAEMDDRMAAAIGAQTHLDLLRVVNDLPDLETTAPSRRAMAPAAASPVPVAHAITGLFLGLTGFVTISAICCTALLLFGASLSAEGGLVWLGAFGTAVSCLGSSFLWHRLRGDQVRPQSSPVPR